MTDRKDLNILVSSEYVHREQLANILRGLKSNYVYIETINDVKNHKIKQMLIRCDYSGYEVRLPTGLAAGKRN